MKARLDKTQSSVHWRWTASVIANGSEDARRLSREMQTGSLSGSVYSCPGPFCGPPHHTTQLPAARLLPLRPWPGAASRLCGRIALDRGSRWLIPSAGLGLFLGTVERRGHMGKVTEAYQS